jgi:hypothetical protein
MIKKPLNLLLKLDGSLSERAQNDDCHLFGEALKDLVNERSLVKQMSPAELRVLGCNLMRMVQDVISLAIVAAEKK